MLRKGRLKERSGRTKYRFVLPFAWTCRPKGAFLEISRIENDIRIQCFSKDRHWDSLKTIPGASLKKHEKTLKCWSENERFLVAKICLKCRNVIDFMVFGLSWKWWKTMRKGTSQIMFFSKMATWAWKVRFILWLLTLWCEFKKSLFFEAFPIDHRMQKIEPWRRKDGSGIHSTTSLGSGFPDGVVAHADHLKRIWGCRDCARCVQIRNDGCAGRKIGWLYNRWDGTWAPDNAWHRKAKITLIKPPPSPTPR